MWDSGLIAAVGQVEVTIDKIQRIANTTLPDAESDVTSKSHGFRDLTLSTDSFGEVPAARALGQQHQAAHQVFVETVQGVIADLQEFRQNLLDSMKAHESNDDAVHATLLALGNRYHDHTYHSDQNWMRGRREQGAHLQTQGQATPAADDTGAGPDSPGTTGAGPDGPDGHGSFSG